MSASRAESGADPSPDTAVPPEQGAAPAPQAPPPAHLVEAAGPREVVVVPPRPVGPPRVSRRRVLLIGFWVAMGSVLLGGAASLLNLLYPRGVTGFGAKIFVGNVSQLAPGQKIHNLEAKVWLVRFDAEQAAHNNAQEGAILALYQKCPHLGCTVPYRPDFTRQDPRNGLTYAGWFLCPCHGSTYSDGGVRVFGPAPRSMDTFALTIQNGQMTVDTGKITVGTIEDPQRAIQPS